MAQSELADRARDADVQITQLLKDAKCGDPGSQDQLFECVYTQLRRMAHLAWRDVPASDTLEPTALVHEMYDRLFNRRSISWESRKHFFCTASRAMHDILVEQARRHGSLKRGGQHKRVHLDESQLSAIRSQACEILELNDALEQLEIHYPDRSRIVMLKIFGGLTYEQIADLEQCSAVTVRRRWAFAKTWLRDCIESSNESSC